jgi:CubicO group peptidase (beta-lactamase class C family)
MKRILLFSCLFVLFFSCSENGLRKRNEPAIEKKDSTSLLIDLPPLDKWYVRKSRSYFFRFYSHEIARNKFSGMFLVSKNGHVMFERTTGYSNAKKKEKLTAETPIHVASISKVATTLAVLRLCDQNLIDLDADVRKYLPELPYDGITVRMLLNHRSGIQYYGYFTLRTWHLGTTMTNKDVLDLIVKHKFRLNFPPGKKFDYCNTNFALLALIAERVTDEKFPEIMKRLIFEPLNMEHSFIMHIGIDPETVAQSYDERGRVEPFSYMDAIYGDKNMYTTARDLLKMDRGTYIPGFISDSLKAQMYTGYSRQRHKKSNYGLGIRITEDKGKDTYFFHTGWWHGNTGCYASLRSDTACVIAISNRYTKVVYQVPRLAGYFGNYPYSFTYE